MKNYGNQNFKFLYFAEKPNGLTHEGLSEILDIKRESVTRYLRKKSDAVPTIEVAAKLYEKYGKKYNFNVHDFYFNDLSKSGRVGDSSPLDKVIRKNNDLLQEILKKVSK